MTCQSTRELLDAHLDGELAPPDAAAVAAHLSSCAECASAYEEELETVRLLRRRLQPDRAPDVLRGRVRAALREDVATQPSRHFAAASWLRAHPRWWQAAAAAMIALASAGTTYLVTGRSAAAPPEAAHEVLSSHLRALMPGHLTDVASNDQHNVKPWFDGRVDVAPDVPRLEEQGFPLIGGRVDYVVGRAVPVVVYGRRKHIISFYSWPADGTPDAAVAGQTRRGYHLLRWRSHGLEHWLVSDLGQAELEQLAALLRHPPSGSATPTTG